MSEERRKRLTIVATILGSTIVFLDGTVVNVALPALSRDLGAGLAEQQWVVESFLLALVALMLVGGALGDQFGRRRMFVIGLIGFGVTSIACAVAPTDDFLIGARAAQGLAGALLVPGSLAILASTFSGAERGKAVGTWTAWSGIATVLGPAGGGLLVDELSWRWIFWVNIPLIALTVFLALRVVEESRDPDAVPAIDWPGIGLSAAGLGGPVFALISQPQNGWDSPVVLVPLVAGLVCLAAFFAWERRAEHPMLKLDLFKIRNFAVTNAETLLVYAGLGGGLFFITLFLQQTAGYSALEAGLATTPISLTLFFLSPRFGRMASGTGPRLPMGAGPIVGGIGLLLLMRVSSEGDYLTEVLPGVMVFAVGLAATVAPLTATALDSVDEHNAGLASGINNAVARAAGLLAIAVIGAVVAGQFGSVLDERTADASLSERGRAAVDRASEKPLGAPPVRNLAPDESETVSVIVTEASESAFRAGALIGGVLMILGGVLGAVGIRNPRRGPERAAPRASTAGDCGHCPEEGEHSTSEQPAAAPA